MFYFFKVFKVLMYEGQRQNYDPFVAWGRVQDYARIRHTLLNYKHNI